MAKEKSKPRKKSTAVVQRRPKVEVVGVDETRIEEAVTWINDRIVNNVHGTYLEIGNYVFEHFFGGDLDQVQSFNPNKASSFQKLSEREDLLISRSHLHRSVHVAIQEKLLLPTFPSMGGLTFTHKAALLPLKSLEAKQELVSQAIDENLTVRELKERVTEAREKEPKSAAGRPTLPGFLKSVKKAHNIFSKEGALAGLTREAVTDINKDEAQELLEKVKHLVSSLDQVEGFLNVIIEGKSEKE